MTTLVVLAVGLVYAVVFAVMDSGARADADAARIGERLGGLTLWTEENR